MNADEAQRANDLLKKIVNAVLISVHLRNQRSSASGLSTTEWRWALMALATACA
jgi:hypothetical protein